MFLYRSNLMKQPLETDNRTKIGGGIFFVLMVFVVALIADRNYQDYKNQLQTYTAAQLANISLLKVDELENWRNIHLTNGEIFHQNQDFARHVQNWLAHPQDKATADQILAWLVSYHAHKEYEHIELLDLTGKPLLCSSGTLWPLPPEVLAQIPETLRTKEVTLVGFYLDPTDQQPYLGLLIPILDPANQEAQGFVTIKIDPHPYLYDYLQIWPLFNQTGETMLVRREGDSVVLLNPSHLKPDAALMMRYALTDIQIPAVQAALGKVGFVEGSNHLGSPVLADIRAVPNSPWLLISKIDAAEAYASLSTRLWGTIFLSSAFLIIIGGIILLVWRQSLMRYYRERLQMVEMLQQSEERYQNFIFHSFEAISRTEFEQPIDTSLPIETQIDLIYANAYMAECNQAMADMYHVPSPAAFVGVRLIDAHGGKDNPVKRNAFRKFIENGYKSINDETQEITADEQPVWFLSNTVGIVKDGYLIRLWGTAMDITERKQMEIALKETRDRLVEAHRLGRMGYWEWTAPGHELTVSEELFHIFELPFSGPAISQKTIAEKMHPNDIARIQALDQQIFAERKDIDYEYSLQVTQERAIWVHQKGKVTYDENGRPIHMIGTIQDITERKEAEEALRESEARARALLKANPDLMFLISREGVFLDYKADENELYLREEDFIGKHFHEVLPLALAERLAQLIQNASETNTLQTFEYQLEIPRRGEQDYEARLVPSTSEEILVLARNITERKRAEEALLAREELYRLISTINADYIFSIEVMEDRQMTLKWVGGGFEAMTGYSFEEYVTMGGWWKTIHPDDMEIDAQNTAQLHNNQKVISEIRTFDKSGAIHWVQIHANPRWDEETQRLTGIYGAVQDITARKEAEGALTQRLTELELLYQSGLTLNRQLEPKQIAERIIEALEKKMDWHHIAIRRYAPESDQFKLLAFKQPGIANEAQSKTVEAHFNKLISYGHQGLSGWVVRHAQAVRVGDVSTDARYVVTYTNIHSGLYVPIMLGERVLGVISVESEALNAFNETDERLLKTVANQAAVAFENAHLFQTLQGELTERKKAEEALRASEERYRLITQYVDDIVWQLDAQLNFVYSSPATKRVLGYAVEEVLGRNVIELLDEEGISQMQKINQARLAGKPLPNPLSDYKMKHKDGHWVDVEVHSVPVFDDQQGLAGFVGVTRQITERKQIELALRASEEKYRGLMESLDSVITTVDQEGRFLYMNDNAAAQLNGLPGDFIGKTMYELFPEAIATAQMANVLQVIQTDQGMVNEAFTFVQGTYRWYRTAILPIHNERQQVIYALINSTDIHELKNAQKELLDLTRTLEARVRERTAEVQDLYDHAPNGYHSLDENCNFLMINQTELTWLGYSREEVLEHQTFYDWLTPESTPVFKESLIHLKQKGAVNGLELELICKNGTRLPVLYNATAIYDTDEKLLHSRATMFDNTERKVHEEALQASEARLHFLLANTPAVIFTAALGERVFITFISQSVQDLLGRPTKDYQVNPLLWRDILHSDDLKQGPEIYARLHQTGHANWEVRAIHLDGTYRWLSMGLSLIHDAHNQPLEIIGYAVDIHPQKKAQEALQISEARLRQSRDELSLANASLAQAARLKDEFLANMSHELRTPLNAVLAFSEGLLEQYRGPLNERQITSVRNIETSGRHLLALINDILDLSKVEAGRLDLQLQPVALADVCEASLLFVKESAAKKQIKLAYELNDHLAIIQTDPKRLKQMLVNLLSNAVKFTPEYGQIGLEVLTDTQMGIVTFAIQDTGIGIAPENLERLFRPFTQLDSSLNRLHEGTGLGLALVRRLAELHGGSVSVQSTLGTGSCFTIALPYLPVTASAPKPSSGTAQQKKETGPLHTALIIDDDESTNEQLSRYMQELGILAFIYAQGKGALEQALDIQPALILLDILMPHQSGWDILEQLKNNPLTQDIPVIIVSVVDERAKGLAAGAVEYLVKPISRELVHEAIHTLSGIPGRGRQGLVKLVPTTSKHILLAEDNEFNIQAISDYLDAKGYQLTIARNGREALELARESPPHLILMDIQMPEMDGLEAIRRLRAMPTFTQTPIIALTALAMPGDQERCLEAGANQYLKKPISLRDLAETIQILLAP